MILEFHYNDHKYEEWLTQVRGYVYNDFGGRNVAYKKLHKSTCSQLHNVRSGQMKTSVRKICSSDIQELVVWLEKTRGPLDTGYSPCGICKPLGYTATTSSSKAIEGERPGDGCVYEHPATTLVQATDGQVKDIVLRFKQVLDEHEEQLRCFCTYGVQLEGWLKGELLFFLDHEKAARKIAHFDREVRPVDSRQRVDIYLQLNQDLHASNVWIELKHWLIGYQKGSKYDTIFYFGDSSSVGIKPDVEKLSKILCDGKYMLILTTANPGEDEWIRGIAKFNERFFPLAIESLTSPMDFPDAYFLGLMQVR